MSTWTRSSACTYGNCVEVRHVDGHVEVRDNTAPDTVLYITPADWAAFLVGAKAGEFDGPAAGGKRTPGEIGAEHYAQVGAYARGEADTSPYGTVPDEDDLGWHVRNALRIAARLGQPIALDAVQIRALLATDTTPDPS